MNNILIVEDDTLIAGDIEATLRRLGHGVSGVAASGEEALLRAVDRPPDLAIMDIKLKGKIDGIETASRLRDAFQTPIVYLTSYTDDRTLRRTRYTEPYGYIVKPFREDDLRATIEMAAYKIVIDSANRTDEANFRKILESASVMVWMAGRDGACSYVNTAWLEFTGSAPGEERGKGWMKCIHPEDLWGTIQTYKIAFEERKTFRMEFRLRRHDGVYRRVEASGVPLRAPGQAFDGFVGICTDINERPPDKPPIDRQASRTEPQNG